MNVLADGERTITTENLEELIEQYFPFLIRTVSTVTGRYVSIEHDDAFSIALSAFAEAAERYQPDKGAFPSFAGLVIRSRLNTWMAQESRHPESVSLEALREQGADFEDPSDQEQNPLKEEIQLYREELALFHLTLEDLADHSPKHRDTRERAVAIAERSSESPPIVSKTYQKKKLPVREVSKHCAVTEKIVKGSKHFILGTMLIFVKKYPALLSWLRKGRSKDV